MSYSKSKSGKKVEKIDPVQAFKEAKAKEKAENSSLSKVKEKMEAQAVRLQVIEILYTGTDDPEFRDQLIAFRGTQQEFDTAFMTHNQRQSQSAQMGAGIYATPIKSEAEGYGAYLIECQIKAGSKWLDLSNQAVTRKLQEAGVNPAQWASANPKAVVKFGETYHVIKTNTVKFNAT